MHLSREAASLQQNWLKQCFVYASYGHWNLKKKVKANCLVDYFECCRLPQDSRQGCLRAPPCNRHSLVWILLEPAMSPGFLPMDTGDMERHGAGAHHHMSVFAPGWRLRGVIASKSVGTAISCSSVSRKALQKTQLTVRLLMLTPYSSSFFCITKHFVIRLLLLYPAVQVP